VNTTVAFVGALHELDEPTLRALIAARLQTVTGINDWYDLADALQRPEAIRAGLARLPRATLARSVDELDASTLHELNRRGLTIHGNMTDDVRCEWELVKESLGEDAGPVDNGIPLSETLERAARERALTLASRLDELLDLVESSGLRSIARGGVSAGDVTRVRAVLGDLPSELGNLVALLAQAGLLVRSDQYWHTADLTQWRAQDNTARWATLSDAWLNSLPTELVQILGTRVDWNDGLTAFIEWTYPLDHTWLTKDLPRTRELAEALGLHTQGVRTQLGAMVVTNNGAGARAALNAHIPEQIDKVMLQSDLTIIAPGPLRADLEAELRLYALVESRSLASTYRLNPILISRAMDAGATAASIEAFLSSISSTGIPQPVTYLIADIGKKHGSIRVRPVGVSSLITCSDVTLTQRVKADSNLTALELAHDPAEPQHLSSPFETSVVMRNLLAAKYPAVLENETGEIQRWVEPRRGRPVTRAVNTAPQTTSSISVVAFDALIERLLGTPLPQTGSDEQWLTRQIEVAIRLKSTLLLTVSLPDGSSREFVIEPRALNNGRLRALDKRSEVERTIPLSSISVVQAPA